MKTGRFAVVTLLLASTAVAQGGRERLVQAELPGFVVGYQLAKGDSLMEERVPHGETVQRWTRMVTTQRFAAMATRVSPVQLTENMSNGLAQACPGARTSEFRSFELAGHAAAEIRGDCPNLTTTGLPESFFVRVIAGTTDLHIVQVAFRRVPNADDAAFARRHLATVVLCDAGTSEPACITPQSK